MSANADAGCENKNGEAHIWGRLALACGTAAASVPARAEDAGHLARIKDVATIEGIRDNQLVATGWSWGCAAPATVRRRSFRRRR